MAPQVIVLEPQEQNVKDIMENVKLEKDRIQVDDIVYSAKKLSDMHPGGELFIKAFAGLDATEAFLSYHRREFPHNRYTDLLIGSANPGTYMHTFCIYKYRSRSISFYY